VRAATIGSEHNVSASSNLRQDVHSFALLRFAQQPLQSFTS